VVAGGGVLLAGSPVVVVGVSPSVVLVVLVGSAVVLVVLVGSAVVGTARGGQLHGCGVVPVVDVSPGVVELEGSPVVVVGSPVLVLPSSGALPQS
jgi:hypothetical protein